MARQRRTTTEIEDLDKAIAEALEEDHPMTVRQVFYRMVVNGVVPKDERLGYKPVMRRLTQLRDNGLVDLDWIIDGIRRVHRPLAVNSLDERLRQVATFYRRHLWTNQTVQPMVVVEKLALAGVLEEVTNEWDVPLVPVQGFASLSLIWQAAKILDQSGRPARVYYFGDLDPSGVKISESFEERLLSYVENVEVTFERVAINREQVEEWNLPTRPTKREGNPHANGFDGDSVELDAIPPRRLRQMVEDVIVQHVDEHALQVVRAAEESEREILLQIAQGHGR